MQKKRSTVAEMEKMDMKKVPLPEKSLLEQLDLPGDLKKLDMAQCQELCQEIRNLLIETVSKTGGHLASNLGAVELTVAMHRVFTSPEDKFVWDVGHQCYTHKILTGRLNAFSTLRQEDGISGFPKPSESEHDVFISGHSSTAISVANGIAEGMRLQGDREHFAIAVIGDGAMTGGLAYEGMNNAGKSGNNLIVILNDNDMSISKNVGSLARYLSSIRGSEGYVRTKKAVERRLNQTAVIGPSVAKVIKNSKSVVREALLHSATLFASSTLDRWTVTIRVLLKRCFWRQSSITGRCSFTSTLSRARDIRRRNRIRESITASQSLTLRPAIRRCPARTPIPAYLGRS